MLKRAFSKKSFVVLFVCIICTLAYERTYADGLVKINSDQKNIILKRSSILSVETKYIIYSPNSQNKYSDCVITYIYGDGGETKENNIVCQQKTNIENYDLSIEKLKTTCEELNEEIAFGKKNIIDLKKGKYAICR